jgi:AcrR family transcriptional regulator
VIAEAERLADEVGLEQMTLTALAERLGVRQPSLYKHIASLDGLRRGIALAAKTELAATLARAAVGQARGDAIHSMSKAYRAWARRHPGRYAAVQRVPVAGDAEDMAAGAAILDVPFAALAG